MSEQEQKPGLGAPEPESSTGSVIRTILVVLVLAALVGAAAWKIHANSQEQATTNTRSAARDASRPLPVLVAPVVQKTMPIYLTALGTVTAYNSVTIKSRVDGELMSVNVREGQSVHKGQVLAQIDPRPYEAALAQAQGQLVKDQANAANAMAEKDRYTALYNAGVVSKESQQSQVSTAGQAAGSIDADQAAIQAAKVNVTYTTITSPIDGVVGLRQVDPGNIVHASDTTGLLLVTQLQPISVIFTLPEDQLPEVLNLVRGGKKLTVEAYDRSEATHLASGALLTLDNQIDTTTGTDKVKAVFPNKDGALFPNQFVNVRLILQQRSNAIVVPASAIQTGNQGTFVYVVKKGMPPAAGGAGSGGGRKRGGGAAAAPAPTPTEVSATAPPAAPAAGGTGRGAGAGGANAPPYYVVAQPVKVDVTEGTQVIVSEGVNPGDSVVIDGQEKLLPNSRVTPKEQEAAPGAGRATGQGAGAFGPGSAGPSEPASKPSKHGLEEGSGVHSGGRGQPPADGQPHPHNGQHRGQNGSGPGQTGPAQ